jgi:hypothetical protein
LVRTLEFTDFKLSPFRCRDPATKDQPPLNARGQNLKRDLLNSHQQEPVDIAGSRQTLILPKLGSRQTGLSESDYIIYIVKENIEYMICSFFFEDNRAGVYFHMWRIPPSNKKK